MAASEALRESGGSIVNTASVAGLTGVGSSIAYSASKAGIINLTRVPPEDLRQRYASTLWRQALSKLNGHGVGRKRRDKLMVR